MKILKVNRRDFVELDNIKKIIIRGDIAWVYVNQGYPKIYKTTESLSQLKNRLVNLGVTIHDFKVEYEN